jgi:hypothetical protein
MKRPTLLCQRLSAGWLSLGRRGGGIAFGEVRFSARPASRGVRLRRCRGRGTCCWRVVAAQDDGDAVEGGIELAVAAAVEPVVAGGLA